MMILEETVSAQIIACSQRQTLTGIGLASATSTKKVLSASRDIAPTKYPGAMTRAWVAPRLAASFVSSIVSLVELAPVPAIRGTWERLLSSSASRAAVTRMLRSAWVSWGAARKKPQQQHQLAITVVIDEGQR